MILAFSLENGFIQAFSIIPVKIMSMIGVLICPVYSDISFSLTIRT